MAPREQCDFHADAPATNRDIMAYVLEKYGVRVFNSNVAYVKKQCGLPVQERFPKTEEKRRRWDRCPPDKAVCIKEALEHFGFFAQDEQ